MDDINNLVQDCGISIANALDIPQSNPEPSISSMKKVNDYPDSKVHGAIWGRQDPGGPHVGPMNLAIWVSYVIEIRRFIEISCHELHRSIFDMIVHVVFGCVFHDKSLGCYWMSDTFIVWKYFQI